MFDINHIASLARLGLSAAEKDKLSADLSLILEYVKQLEEAETSEIEPIFQICDAKDILRKDEASVIDLELSKKIVSLAPTSQNGFIKIKKILD